MKNILTIAICTAVLFGCNMNPNKEARIQELETEMQKTADKVTTLEAQLQTLEAANTELASRTMELEKK